MLELSGVLWGPDGLPGTGRGEAMRRDQRPGGREDGQQWLSDAGADLDGPAGVGRPDAVAVAPKRDQRRP